MKTIGILGGMGPQASAKLLELIITKTPAFTNVVFDNDFPEIVLLNVRVPNFINDAENFTQTLDILKHKTKVLEDADCTINAIACNTAHLFLPELRKVTKVPFLSIPEMVAKTIRTKQFKRIGLLGTPTTLRSRLFDDALSDVDVVRPDVSLAKFCETVIFAQIAGTITPQQKDTFREVVSGFMQQDNLDSVILGCTELPLVFGDSGNPRILDTLDILSDALLEEYFAAA